MTSWRTTAAAAVTAAFGFVLFSPQYFPGWLIDMSKYAMLGGLAAMGIAAKDSRVHSTADEVVDASVEQKRKALDAASGR